MRVALGGAQHIGQVDDAVRLRGNERFDHVVHHRDVAVRDFDFVAQRVEDRRVRIDVHAVDLVPVLDQLTHHAWADESAPTKYCNTHPAPPLTDLRADLPADWPLHAAPT